MPEEELFQKEINRRMEVVVNQKYRTFNWLPHATLAKHLSKEQLITAFNVM